MGRAQWRDLAGMSGVVCESFKTEDKKFVNAVARRSAWMVAFGKRLSAMERGELAPHSLIVARDNFGVLGVAEVGLLPAPPGVTSGLPSSLSQPNAEWRGVPLDRPVAFLNDVPTIANVAVAKRARRKKIGTRLVEAALSQVSEEEDWKAYRRRISPDEALKLYARVTDPQVGRFWLNCGFELEENAVGPDVRGKHGQWLSREAVILCNQ